MKDLKGLTFNRLKVISFNRLKVISFNRLKVISFNRKENYKFYWNCLCSCGKDTVVERYKIESGHTKSCGCLIKESRVGRKRKDLDSIKKEVISKTFGKLKVIEIFRRKSIIKAKCLCSCGTEKEAVLSNIIRGHTRSCGCNRSVALVKYAKDNSGYKNKNWKGGVRITSGGYALEYFPEHPKSDRNYISQHRLVMEGILGRYLHEDEAVHHKNGVRNDNRPDNLELWTKTHPNGQRVEDILNWCVETIKKYKPELLKENNS